MKTIEIRYFIPYPATLDEGKAMYRKLAAMNHPDHGGDAEVMKAINTEWEYLKTRLPRFNPTGKAHDFGADHARETEKAQKQAAVDAELRPMCYKLDRAGIQYDVVGKWIWTDDRRAKRFGFILSARRNKFYWRPESAAEPGRGSNKSYQWIYQKYNGQRGSSYRTADEITA